MTCDFHILSFGQGRRRSKELWQNVGHWQISIQYEAGFIVLFMISDINSMKTAIFCRWLCSILQSPKLAHRPTSYIWPLTSVTDAMAATLYSRPSGLPSRERKGKKKKEKKSKRGILLKPPRTAYAEWHFISRDQGGRLVRKWSPQVATNWIELTGAGVGRALFIGPEYLMP